MPSPALTLARAAGLLSRRLGRGGGTSLPGKLLLALQPGAVGRLGKGLGGGVAVISATNGKTTTARLTTAALRAGGHPVLANPAGANLLSGVATALLGRPEGPNGAGADRFQNVVGLFEVDEAALPAVAEQLRPRVVVLMNLFRDQLDRYGELEILAERWERMVAGLPSETTVVLNADDPAVAALAPGRAGVVTFGIEDPRLALDALPHAADSTRCRSCSASLIYDRVYLGHMGAWRCPSCGLARPTPDVRAVAVELDGVRGQRIAIETPAGPVEARLALPGLYNSYNATAATAAALALGVAPATIGPAMEASPAAFGRAERVVLAGREVVLLLAKNPAGANETVRTVLLDPEPLDLLLALNDRTADGHDVSWIWDVDYEPLLPRIRSLTLTGDRAYDLALRFRYAGLDEGLMHVEPDAETALDRAVAGAGAHPGAPLYVLPTYTAMLGLRRILVQRGAAAAFWRDGR